MDKVTFYTVIEKQVFENGTKATLNTDKEDYNEALSTLYTILAAASISDLPYHAGFIMRDDGLITDGKAFDRRTIPEPVQPEVEPLVEEPGEGV